MKDIRFRAWDGQKMVAVEKLEFVPASKSFTGKDGWTVNDHLGIPPENLMQFTGLKDKSGKEIYEGDIVLYSHGGWNYKAVIFWANKQVHGWMVREQPRGHDGKWGNINTEPIGSIYHDNGMATIEVIGNIHGNPELVS